MNAIDLSEVLAALQVARKDIRHYVEEPICAAHLKRIDKAIELVMDEFKTKPSPLSEAL